MTTPERLLILWRGRQVVVRHDDPSLGPLSSMGKVIFSAIELCSTVENIARLLTMAIGDHYRIRVAERDGGVLVGLWRLNA